MTTTIWGSIQGREITFPMEVDSFNSATLGFSVPAAAAAALLPGERFEIAETAPGIAQLIVSLVDYRENPWGDYNEVNLGFLTRPVGAGEEVIGSFVYRMPVDQEFTCVAGNEVMGFPKTVTRIDATYTDDAVTFELFEADSGDDRSAFRISLPRVEPTGEPTRIETGSYSYLDGVAYETPLAIDMASGFVDAADVEITIGSGPIADELRSLGLPTAPDFCSYGEGLGAVFQLGSAL
ncbi:MAG: acetoacetate decarboxylase family protein [Nocardioides sp.]